MLTWFRLTSGGHFSDLAAVRAMHCFTSPEMEAWIGRAYNRWIVDRMLSADDRIKRWSICPSTRPRRPCAPLGVGAQMTQAPPARPSSASIEADREEKSDPVEHVPSGEIRESPSDPGGESCRARIEFGAC